MMVRIPANRGVPDLVFFITAGLRNREPLFSNPKAAQIVVDSLQYFRQNGEIELYGFVVMPDHVHVVLKARAPLTVSQFVKRMKTHTAHSLDKGPIWEKGFWSEVIEGEVFMRQKLVYVHENPVRAGLVVRSEEYPWSSAKEYFCKSTSDVIDPY